MPTRDESLAQDLAPGYPMERKMGLLLLATALSAAFFLQTVGAKGSIPAIFVLGDSTVDVGNNNYLPGNRAKANFPHNGIDYPHHKPTGRFSNGYNGVDFLAKKLRFKKSPPPYLSITRDAQIFEGVSFASGGSGILDTTGQNYSVSLNTQIKYFEGITHRLKTLMGDAAVDRFLSKSLFVFSTGSNDMFGFYFTFGLQNKTLGDQFIGLLANQLKNQLQMLYNLGARKFTVFGSSPIGCIPLLRRTTPSGDCVEALSKFSQQYNKATEGLLSDLASTFKDMSYSFVDVYEVISAVTSNPLKYGFKEIRSACCGSGLLNADSACTPNATYCSNRRDHLFWDQYHPTQTASKLVAHVAYDGRQKFVTPLNVEQLAKS